MKKILLACLIAGTAQAVEIPIEGTVQSQCLINTDKPGVYGSPNAYTPVSYTHLTLPTKRIV